jgi:hypothetical protein
VFILVLKVYLFIFLISGSNDVKNFKNIFLNKKTFFKNINHTNTKYSLKQIIPFQNEVELH